ncbi:MAG: hypothetical protein HZB10_04075 [Candidatus Yonathbacteria bacterium]|nr:hypothetical protein [Candidatus Yonathbacteria bacterium]
MEGELLNQIQKPAEKGLAQAPLETKSLPIISFVPSELLMKIEGGEFRDSHDRCALFGLVLGVMAVVSWIVILFGVVYSVAGIALSVIGLKSTHQKWAKIGLGLSVLGLVLSVSYVLAAYNGMINYNYFTSEFWTI